jgi:hypothetical protein
MAAANPEEVRAMKERLRARQAERRQEAEDAEVFGLFRDRKPAASVPAPVKGTDHREKIGAVPMYGTVTAGLAVAAVMNGIVRNWLFEMVLGLAVFAAAVL